MALLSGFAGSGGAPATIGDASGTAGQAPAYNWSPPAPKYPKLDPQLNALAEQEGADSYEAASQTLLFHEGSVGVTVFLKESSSDFTTFLEQGGGWVNHAWDSRMEAYVPIDLLPDLAERPEVKGAMAITRPRENAVISEGTVVHNSTAWNAAGFTGEGVKVGIIDSGFSGFTDLANLDDPELPHKAGERCFHVSCESGSVHGTAVAEAIVDMAPGVSLYISNPTSQGDIRTAVNWMIDQGVQVINYSRDHPWEGYGDGTWASAFENTSIMKTVDIAVEAGILWVNSAGNQGRQNWYGPYIDENENAWLEFKPGVESNPVEVLVSEGRSTGELVVDLRWDDDWGAAEKDLTVCIFEEPVSPESAHVVCSERQVPPSWGIGDYPVERFSIILPAGTYYLAIRDEAPSTPSPAWVQLNLPNVHLMDIWTPEASVSTPGESNNPGMLAVGAASHAQTETIEIFSGQGPTVDGRTKPEIVGADRADSVTYPDGEFRGTSQSAPHVAGMAALVLERFPGLTPVEVADYLKQHAQPRGDKPNNTWGWGVAYLLPAITGSVSLQGVAPSDFNNMLPMLTLLPEGETSGDTVIVSASSDGSFFLGDVPPGTYTVIAESEGFVARRRGSLVIGADTEVLATAELFAGLVDDDDAVGAFDMSAVVAALGMTSADLDGRKDSSGNVVDLNGDGVVDDSDLSIAIGNYGIQGVQDWP